MNRVSGDQIKRRGFRTEKEAAREMRNLLQQVDDHTYIKNTKKTKIAC
ncbi:Arm DNA-binding domain-containing protein [Paenibacillus thiaminolyticus]